MQHFFNTCSINTGGSKKMTPAIDALVVWALTKLFVNLTYQTLPTTQFVTQRSSKAWKILTSKRRKTQQNHHLQPLLSFQASGAILGALVYRGIHSDLLRSRPEQSHHLPGALLPRWLQAESPMVVPSFNSTTLVDSFAIYIHLFEDMLKKVC